jgi:hypothetical protein
MTPRDWRRKRRLLLNAAVVLVVGLAVLRVATRGSTVIAVAAVLALAGGAWLAVDTVRRRRAGREHDAGGIRTTDGVTAGRGGGPAPHGG